MDSPALLCVALAKLKTVTTQTTLKTLILGKRMILKTENSETYSMDKGICAIGDSGQLKGVRRLVEQHEADPTALQLHLMMMMKNQSLKDEERDLKTTILERKITELENEKALREAQCTFMRQQVDTQNEQMNALQTLIVQCNKKMEELSNVVKVMRKDLYLLEEQNQKLEDEIQQGLYSSSRMHMMKDGADYMDTVKNEIKLTNGVKHHQEPVVLKSNAQDVLVGKEITSVLLKMKENDYGQLPPHLTRFTHSEPLKGLSDDDLKERIHTLTGRTVEELLGLIDIKVTSDNLVLLSHLLIVKANQMTENDVMDEENIGACGRSRGDDNMWMSPEDDNVMQQINQLEKRVTEVEMEMMEKRSLESMSLGNHSSHLDDLLTIGSDAQISYSMAVRHNLSSLGSNGTHINVSIPTLSAVPRKNQKKQSKPKTSLNIVCYNCQKPGHKAIDCRSRKR
uniref:Uncharacterized protein LOC102802434 n=1 Tax=Saccoglossus kowalevskii TaxID=10224 RepID=A0ABM0MK80_SACKO|nr:PREDICTED: uncharacterized protein LOC102802434 [Saccoglossus kowalevskii]